MTALIHGLGFLAVLCVALVLAFVLPEAMGWPQRPVTILTTASIAVVIVFQMLLLYRRLARDAEGWRQRAQALEARLDRLETAAERLRADSETGERQSGEMLQEMRVLQTLLSQIVERSGDDEAGAGPSVGIASGEGPEATPRPSPDRTRDILRGALSENRVDLYLQPTVVLPSRKSQHYECVSRLRGEDGKILYPSEYLPVAEGAGLSGTLDNLLLFRCIQLIRKLGPRRPETRFFCNISSSSLSDTDFFPQFVEYMAMNTELAERLVFEFAQADFTALGDEERRRLVSLGRAGYRFSLDHVESRRIDPRSLADQYVAFVKLDIDVLCAEGEDPSPARLRERLARHGVSLIASKVEEETQVLDLLDFHIELAQGFLFGEPRLSREEPRGQ